MIARTVGLIKINKKTNKLNSKTQQKLEKNDYMK